MRLILSDDHLTFRESLRIAFQAHHLGEIVGETATVKEALKLVGERKPDLVVSDLMLKDSDGISFVRELKRLRLRVPVLVLTRISHPAFVRDALTAGARGYALKDDPLVEIMNGVNVVAQGARYLSPKLPDPTTTGAQKTDLDELSAREREVFCRLIEGWSTKDIARELSISLKTVEAHRFRINRKLGVRSPTQLLSYAAAQGLM